MRFVTSIMMALALTAGCAPSRPEMPDRGIEPVAETEALPTVLIRLQIIRDWDSPYFIVESEDHLFTLAQAVAFGIPAEMWIRGVIECKPGEPYAMFWVRPIYV
jgi:hypothetical protein